MHSAALSNATAASSSLTWVPRCTCVPPMLMAACADSGGAGANGAKTRTGRRGLAGNAAAST
eukprot:351596-Chlamydomonas_euryale.AAC.7